MFDLREKIINFFRDYCFLLSETKYKEKYEKGFKYTKSYIFFYQANEITEKVYNNIVNSYKTQ